MTKPLRVQIMSDVHVETHLDGGAEFVSMLDPSRADVLVLAGDIAIESILGQTLRMFCERYDQVVFVAGNHEHWGASPKRVAECRRLATKRLKNLHWLEDSVVTVEGVRFIGATLWFPDTPAAQLYQRDWSDFKMIAGLVPYVWETNRRSSNFLYREVREGDVVVTHYLPSHRSVSEMYSRSVTNCYFLSDEERTIFARQPALWIHGHTHESCDYLHPAGETRVVCNPFGYRGDLNRAFVDDLVIEVTPVEENAS